MDDQNLGDVGVSTEDVLRIESQVLLWIAWGKIAITHEAAANKARKRSTELHGAGDNLDNALNEEFQSSLVVVTAAANALEALYGGLRARNTSLTKSDNYRPDWRKIWLSLDGCFELNPQEQATWPERLRWLFEVKRKAVVHFHEPSRPLGTHPIGFQTSPEYCEYTKEEAALCVDLVLEILTVCSHHSVRSVDLKVYQGEIQGNATDLVALRRQLTP